MIRANPTPKRGLAQTQLFASLLVARIMPAFSLIFALLLLTSSLSSASAATDTPAAATPAPEVAPAAATAQEAAPPATPPEAAPPAATPPPASRPIGNPRPKRSAIAGDRESLDRTTREIVDTLPPAQRRHVLETLKKVWKDADVRVARKNLRLATENHRQTVRLAMEEIDPDVATTLQPLLDQLLKSGVGPNGWADRSPPASSQDGAPRYLRLLGVSANALATMTPPERALLDSARTRVMQDPRVRQAAAALAAQTGPSRSRGPAMQELRRTTRAVAIELEPAIGPASAKIDESGAHQKAKTHALSPNP